MATVTVEKCVDTELNDPYMILVRDHFNGIVGSSKRDRKTCETFRIRNANNYCKSVFLKRFVPIPGSRILDCGSARGQDVQKFVYCKPDSVVFADFSKTGLEETVRRWKREKCPYPATFRLWNFCGQVPLLLPGEPLFDVVSCQFALHYACGNLESLSTFLANISSVLKPNGLFLSSFPNSNVLLEMANKDQNLEDGRTFDNGIFRAIFEDGPVRHGSCYYFDMKETVSCKQYVAELPVIQSEAARHGLELEYTSTFENYLNEAADREGNRFSGLAFRMGINGENALSDKELDVIRLYRLAVFRKGNREQCP